MSRKNSSQSYLTILILLIGCTAIFYYCTYFKSDNSPPRYVPLVTTISDDYKHTNKRRSSTNVYQNAINQKKLSVKLFVNNTQGLQLGAPPIRYNVGPLPHKHVASIPMGSIDSCNADGLRYKHIVNSSAMSLNWNNDNSENKAWEIANDRRMVGHRSNKKIIAHILITDDLGITKVDSQVAYTTNEELNNLTNQQLEIKERWRGQDHRVILWKGSQVVVYSSYMKRQMWLYHHAQRKVVMLTICGHSTSKVEKNWTPLVISNNNGKGDILLLVYSIDPLVILSYNIEQGDGVCMLLYGDLPMKNMNEPYGGTPFKEIHNDDNGNNDDIKTRSFLSIAHTRNVNEDEEDAADHGRVYRPIPVVLHIFCATTDNNEEEEADDNIRLLNGCTFGVDIFDTWPEIDSPEEVKSSKWKRQYRSEKEVSYPYDLQVFQQHDLIRVGITYEDCYNVYEDFTIDFDILRKRQLNHPIRLKLATEKKKESNNVDLSTYRNVHFTSSMSCPTSLSHAGEKVQTKPIIEESDLVDYLAGAKIWLASHGGVSEEHIRKHLIQQTDDYPKPTNKQEEMMSLGYFPYPIMNKEDPSRVPQLCVFVYCSIYESILLQLDKNPSMARLLHNNKSYPKFNTLEELLSHPDPDPFGIQSQFEQFLTARVPYPMLLVRCDIIQHPDGLEKVESTIYNIIGKRYDLVSLYDKEYTTKYPLEVVDNVKLRDEFRERYSELDQFFQSQPLIRLLMPQDAKDRYNDM